MSEWHWPQTVLLIGMTLRASKLVRDDLREAKDSIDRVIHPIVTLSLTAFTAFLLHEGGFW